VSAPASELFVDGVEVVLWLLREQLPDHRPGLSEVNVFEDMPERLADYLPAVQVSRTGGATDHPRFYGQFWLPIQVWSNAEGAWDQYKAAFELSNQVARILYLAWEQQVVTPYGSVNKWRESTGFHKVGDPNLPFAGRYVATYDLLIRNPRAR
jgi:hypothetical protein